MEPDTSPSFFDRVYREGDPWHFDSDPYEQGRYATILAALGTRRFERAYEPGCSVGAFTALLAPRCDQVVARDVSPAAIELARVACAPYPQVDLGVGAVEVDRPPGRFDLIVFSEIGYYFEEPQLHVVIDDLVGLLHDEGTLIGSHWTGRSDDHRIGGRTVVAGIQQHPDLLGSHSEHPGFLLGRWTKRRHP